MKEIFSDKLLLYDAGTFVWCHSNETYRNDCLKKTNKISPYIYDKVKDMAIMIIIVDAQVWTLFSHSIYKK